MRTRLIAVLLILAFVFVFSLTQFQPAAEKAKEAVSHEGLSSIDVSYLQTLQDQKNPFLLLDVRQPDEYIEGHIEGSVLLPLGDLAAHISELPKDKTIVVYCRSGRRSAQAVALLKEQGFDEVLDLAGGYQAWTQSAKATTREQNVCMVSAGC